MARTTWDRDEYDETGALLDDTGPHGSGRHIVDDGRIHLPSAIDAAHIARQRAFSYKTFGPGRRTHGVLDHIRKELDEIALSPYDIEEWVDVVILALDGAWRAGHGPQEIIDAIIAKQAKNEVRTWPDWKTAPEGKAIEHDRSGEQQVDFVSGQESNPTESIQHLRQDETEIGTARRCYCGPGALPHAYGGGRHCVGKS